MRKADRGSLSYGIGQATKNKLFVSRVELDTRKKASLEVITHKTGDTQLVGRLLVQKSSETMDIPTALGEGMEQSFGLSRRARKGNRKARDSAGFATSDDSGLVGVGLSNLHN